ncbi:beta-amylase [Chloropicon primus]|uniref:Beta-amylase n=1 Tax=Chloropicon primus TaxID=1764295 RepID=A0A5B8MN59_9CHLO|nr:beta-amylase [Chloropicon primus]UPR01057.1 beta-amylase [Chloropicon primus]|eukprot:QDZ21837.1 beta-amylase [Chloropicon primus]
MVRASVLRTCESLFSGAAVVEVAEEAGLQEESNVPVYVMLPLDTVWRQEEQEGVYNPVLKTPKKLNDALRKLREAGVTGVMVDVWWGMVEADTPGRYNFDAYLELLKMAALNGLKVQAVMSFHAAGGNVGDNVNIPLPDWVLQVGQDQPDIFFTDASGHVNPECLSLGCDGEPVLRGRTPVQAYRDFVEAFLTTTEGYLGWVVSEVTVGLGPAGEMRYPSYPEGDGRWRFPGIGEFQCYDAYMLADLKEKAKEVGHPEWGHGGPHDSGNYTKCPWETGFFHPQNGSYNTEYGNFFLEWYSDSLIDHGDRVLTSVSEVVRSHNSWSQQMAVQFLREDGAKMVRAIDEVKVGIKIAGVHWWYKSISHAGELTAGYYNTRNRSGYRAIMEMLKKHGAVANFTAVEMRDCEQPDYAKCSPQGLLAQLQEEALEVGIPLSGENALQRYDKFALDQIEHASYGEETKESCPQLKRLTFLRMGPSMFDNWDAFESFVVRMNRRRPHETAEALSLQNFY